MAGIGRIIAVALILFGCAPRPNVTGTWKGRRDVSHLPSADPVVVANMARVVLTLKPNGRFDIFDQGFPYSGMWSQTSEGASLSVDQAFDRRLEPGEPKKEYTVTLQKDGSAKLSSLGQEVSLQRESQP